MPYITSTEGAELTWINAAIDDLLLNVMFLWGARSSEAYNGLEPRRGKLETNSG